MRDSQVEGWLSKLFDWREVNKSIWHWMDHGKMLPRQRSSWDWMNIEYTAKIRKEKRNIRKKFK